MSTCKSLSIMMLALMLVTCSDPWDERFDPDQIPSLSVWEIIDSEPAYSGFKNLLIETGYDTILQRNTAFTVFVPTGNSIEGLGNMNVQHKIMLAASHISNSVIYNKDISKGNFLKTLSGKNINFEINGNAIEINRDVIITRHDILASNGVLHEISGPQVIRPNIMEYIHQQETFSHISDFFNENTTLEFDRANSVPVGINDFGQTIFDTIWKKSNPFFNDLADISSEDHQFTIFLAGNTLLDTTDSGQLKPGYLSNLGSLILEGFFDPSQLSQPLVTVSGKQMNLPAMTFKEIGRASNGALYELLSFSGIPIPKLFSWELTAIADFDSIRFVRQVNYAGLLDQLKDIRVYDVEGSFTAFSYAFDPRARNTDYLRIQTSAGTSASIDIKLPDMAPGEYNLLMNAMNRVNDGIHFDVFFNGMLTKAGVSLNGGSFTFEDFELGTFAAVHDTGNILTLKISGSNPTQRSGFIDYLTFVPVK